MKKEVEIILERANLYENLLTSWLNETNINKTDLIGNDGLLIFADTANEIMNKISKTTMRTSIVRLANAYYCLDLCILCAAKLLGDENYTNFLYKPDRNGRRLLPDEHIIELITHRMKATYEFSEVFSKGRYASYSIEKFQNIMYALTDNLYILNHLYNCSLYNNINNFIKDITDEFNKRNGICIEYDLNSYYAEDLKNMNNIRLNVMDFFKMLGHVRVSMIQFIHQFDN